MKELMNSGNKVVLIVAASLLMTGCASKFDEAAFNEQIRQYDADSTARNVTPASQLGAETSVGQYKFRPPKSFVQQKVERENGKENYAWKEQTTDGLPAALLVRISPSRVSEEARKSKLEILYKGVLFGMSMSIGMSDFRQTEPERVDINGIPFVYGKWSGVRSGKLCYGFTYITTGAGKLLVLTGVSQRIAGFRIADASARTFRE